MPNSQTRRARLSASSRRSSSHQARSGPDSSQHAIHCASQRLVSCHARKRGARYSSSVRPNVAEGGVISGEPDVRLGHHLLGDVLKLWRFPPRLASSAQLFELLLLTDLSSFDRQLHFAHLRSSTGLIPRQVRCWPRTSTPK